VVMERNTQMQTLDIGSPVALIDACDALMIQINMES
jgi:hypothetical protein